MRIGKTSLTTGNYAPSDANNLAIFDGTTKLCDVDISNIKLPTDLGTKLYSFGLLSDLHLNTADGYTNSNRFNNALTYFENQNCTFCCHTGDMTNIGFWHNATDTAICTQQFGEYKRIIELHPNLPVYGVCGNHDSYSKPITQNIPELITYTGHGLNYSITQGNDVYIFIGQPNPTTPMTDEAYTWLETTINANKNKRCFIFIHSFVSDSDSGNPLGLYSNKTFDWWGTKTTTFINLLAKNRNTMLFHGHSHMHFDTQAVKKNAIYSTALGFKSLHVPSIYNCRHITNETLNVADACLGYIVDVYTNYIIIKSIDFLNNNANIITALYCIDFRTPN